MRNFWKFYNQNQECSNLVKTLTIREEAQREAEDIVSAFFLSPRFILCPGKGKSSTHLVVDACQPKPASTSRIAVSLKKMKKRTIFASVIVS